MDNSLVLRRWEKELQRRERELVVSLEELARLELQRALLPRQLAARVPWALKRALRQVLQLHWQLSRYRRQVRQVQRSLERAEVPEGASSAEDQASWVRIWA